MDGPQQPGAARFDPALVHEAARRYYLEGSTQADIAVSLQVSRPTVSRLLTEARRIGLVHIEIRHPDEVRQHTREGAAALAAGLGLDAVYLAAGSAAGAEGDALRLAVGDALAEVDLRHGDAVLLSSGRTVFSLSRYDIGLPPGLQIAPAVAGMAEPEAWYQSNEIVRELAQRSSGHPHFLFAPAMPTPAMYRSLRRDTQVCEVTALWSTAKAALVGVGEPTGSRSSIWRSVPGASAELTAAVGDVCLNFYDLDGRVLPFAGSDRMVRVSPDQLRALPASIAVAVGAGKVASIVAGARSGMFSRLVTDAVTARALTDHLARSGG